MKLKLLPQSFYNREPDVVAQDLLGKLLIRKLDKETLIGRIVETEAYFGPEDPASRARRGKLPHNSMMWGPPGTLFIYMVHNNWLLNVVTKEEGEPSAVLIRALEPLQGIETMKRLRGKEDIKNLTNGPGKLTKALAITKEFNGLKVFNEKSPIVICDDGFKPEKIARSKRIGVPADLEEPMRFYIQNNRFVSR